MSEWASTGDDQVRETRRPHGTRPIGLLATASNNCQSKGAPEGVGLQFTHHDGVVRRDGSGCGELTCKATSPRARQSKNKTCLNETFGRKLTLLENRNSLDFHKFHTFGVSHSLHGCWCDHDGHRHLVSEDGGRCVHIRHVDQNARAEPGDTELTDPTRVSCCNRMFCRQQNIDCSPQARKVRSDLSTTW